MANNDDQGRGWHDNPEGHTRAGEQSSGQFKEGTQHTKDTAEKGGEASSGSFKEGSERAQDAGREGGKNSH